ncbi:clusterin-like protein 1 isoform X2 [Lissotriton helveticus]
MNAFLLLAMYLLWLRSHHSAPQPEEEITHAERLKRLSKVGEELVDGEVKKALAGVKQMKIIMDKNVEQHKDLMKSLKRSSEEKQEALHLMEEIKSRLSEEEGQCQSTLQGTWVECKPCLETSCLIFYTTNCIEETSKFTSTVEEFFRGLSLLSSDDDEEQDGWSKEKSEEEDAQLMQMETWFGQLTSDIRATFDQSIALFKEMQTDFDQPFQRFFMSDSPDIKAMAVTTERAVSADDPFQGWNIPGFFQTVLDFGSDICERFKVGWETVVHKFETATKDLLEEVTDSRAILTRILSGHDPALCTEFQKNTSGCLQFQERCQQCQNIISKDCPDVPELRLKTDEALKLVNRSHQQHHQIFQIVQQHAEDTASLMLEMKKRFGWVSELGNMSTGSENIFNIVKVSSSHNNGDFARRNETIVEVNILNLPVFSVRVPSDLDIESPKFIEYVADQALQHAQKNVQGHE